jgi:hypothetical protein
MVCAFIKSLLSILNGNSGAIAAVATTASVVIAAVYTFYTTRLWKVSLLQAHSAELQAETARRQFQLMERQMAAAEKISETVHRPHLLIEANIEFDAGDPGPKGTAGRLAVLGKNYGTTAATVMSVKCNVSKSEGTGGAWGARLLPIVIPPGDTAVIGRALLQPPPDVEIILTTEGIAKLMLWFHIYIRYRGASETEYCTQVQICLVREAKDRTRWLVLSVTPSGPEFWEIHGGTMEKELAADHPTDAKG